MVIIHHFPGTVKQYAQATICPGRDVALPDRCPHPACQAEGSLIRWGTYTRWACTEEGDYRLRIQRVRCKVCGRTHSLLPDFLHPHRHYVLSLLQRVVSLYLIAGLGFGRLLAQLPDPGPAPSTIREWISAFAYGAGQLLLTALTRFLLTLAPATELPGPPPTHLDRVSNPTQHHRLARAHHFWLLAEQLYPQDYLFVPTSRPDSPDCTSVPLNCCLLCCIGSNARPFRPASSGHRPCQTRPLPPSKPTACPIRQCDRPPSSIKLLCFPCLPTSFYSTASDRCLLYWGQHLIQEVT